MIKAAVILQIIHIESNADSPRKVKKNPEDYPLADTLPKSVKTYTYGFLIGNNYYNVIILDERKKTQDNLYVINQKLLWIISGRASSTNDNEKENIMFAITPASRYLPVDIDLMTMERDSALFEANIEELWNLETIRIKSKANQERDDLVMQMFKNTITKED